MCELVLVLSWLNSVRANTPQESYGPGWLRMLVGILIVCQNLSTCMWF